MKYMTFNSSCSFAGLANMLEQYGISTDDRTIALSINAPYIFSKCGEAYITGAMLQSAEWFNLYLNTIGYVMHEYNVSKYEAAKILKHATTAMLGLRLIPQSKHAVTYIGYAGGHYKFINNKWKGSNEPEHYTFSESDLLSRLDSRVTVATIEMSNTSGTVDFLPLLKQSLSVLDDLKHEIIKFCSVEQSFDAQIKTMDPLFRPLLLDGVTMLEITGDSESVNELTRIRTEYMNALRLKSTVRLFDHISEHDIEHAVCKYRTIIAQKIKEINNGQYLV